MIDSGENSGDFVMLFDNKSTNKGKNQLNTKINGTFTITTSFADKNNTGIRVHKRANILNINGYIKTTSAVTSGQVIGVGYFNAIGVIPEESQIILACDTGAVTFGTIRTDGALQIIAAAAGAHYYRFNATMVV